MNTFSWNLCRNTFPFIHEAQDGGHQTDQMLVWETDYDPFISTYSGRGGILYIDGNGNHRYSGPYVSTYRTVNGDLASASAVWKETSGLEHVAEQLAIHDDWHEWYEIQDCCQSSPVNLILPNEDAGSLTNVLKVHQIKVGNILPVTDALALSFAYDNDGPDVTFAAISVGTYYISGGIYRFQSGNLLTKLWHQTEMFQYDAVRNIIQRLMMRSLRLIDLVQEESKSPRFPLDDDPADKITYLTQEDKDRVMRGSIMGSLPLEGALRPWDRPKEFLKALEKAVSSESKFPQKDTKWSPPWSFMTEGKEQHMIEAFFKTLKEHCVQRSLTPAFTAIEGEGCDFPFIKSAVLKYADGISPQTSFCTDENYVDEAGYRYFAGDKSVRLIDLENHIL